MTKNEQWLRERKTYIGGSDIAAICELSSYKTPLQLYLDKTSEEIIITNDNLQNRGHTQEDSIAQKYSHQTGFNIDNQDQLLRHPDYPFIAANIDRWADNKNHIVECKSMHFMKAAKIGRDMPDYYLCQIAYYVGICYKIYGTTRADIALEIGEDIKNSDGSWSWNPTNFRIYTYERDSIFESKLFQMAINFWNNHIIKRIPPKCINLSDTKQLYNNSDGSPVHANDNIMIKIEQLKNLKSREKIIEQEIKNIQLEIQVFMKNSEILLSSDNAILATWKQTKQREAFDMNNFQEEHKELYVKYIKENKTSRTFLIK